MIKLKTTYLLFILIGFSVLANAQGNEERYRQIENKLANLAVEEPGLEEEVELSVNGVSIQEFLRGVANANDLNISVDPNLDIQVVNNFSNVTVNDVLLFLVRQYRLDINLIGNIISVSEYIPPPEPEPEKQPKEIKVSYNEAADELTMDLDGDSLKNVAKAVTRKSEKNVVLAPGLSDKSVRVYIQDMPFDNALEKFAFANNLMVTKTEDGFYLLQNGEGQGNEQAVKGQKGGNGNGFSPQNNTQNTEGFDFEAKNMDEISVQAINAPVSDIIKAISDRLGLNYYLVSDINSKTTLMLKDVSYEQLLKAAMKGTDYTFNQTNGIYVIGERKDEGLRTIRIYQLQHRTVEKVMDYIPQELNQGVSVKEFPDLNSLVLSGSEPVIIDLISFLRSIDKVVPVVLIEVMIVDYKKDRTLSTGISAGIGEEPVESGGKVYPGVDFTFSASSVNKLINTFNGYGLLNIGQVTPNFYLSIKALESEGIIRVRSTPKLATLNGSEATMSIGNTEYYLEQSNNVIGSQNPQNIITQKYKSVTADLSVSIKPFVSGSDQITLNIDVEQSDFTGRISPDAPPGSVTRSFSSLVRVKNEEMVLLGGLEEKSVNNSGSGVPLLARIPIIKWLFSSRTRQKSKSKLNIFIKPTVIY